MRIIEALQDRLLALKWTDAVDETQLATLAPLADDLDRAVAAFKFWQRLGFAFLMGVALSLYAAWLPIVVVHLRSLVRQVEVLRATADALVASRGAAPSLSSTGTARSGDPSERRTRFLIRVCFTRAAIAICASLRPKPS